MLASAACAPGCVSMAEAGAPLNASPATSAAPKHNPVNVRMKSPSLSILPRRGRRCGSIMKRQWRVHCKIEALLWSRCAPCSAIVWRGSASKASSWAMTVRAFAPGMISKRGSKSTMVEANCFRRRSDSGQRPARVKKGLRLVLFGKTGGLAFGRRDSTGVWRLAGGWPQRSHAWPGGAESLPARRRDVRLSHWSKKEKI